MTESGGLLLQLRKTPRWFRALLGASVVVVAALALGGQHVGREFMNTPDFCRSCHEPNVALLLFAEDSHHDMDCQACHSVDEMAVREMLIATVLQDSSRPHRATHPSDYQCRVCHQDPKRTDVTVLESPGHRQHRPRVQCLRCHGSRFHSLRKPENQCRDCHAEASGPGRLMSEVHCKSCHNFVDANAAIVPTRRDCRRCHARHRVWMPALADDSHMSQLPCFACHEAHGRQPPETCEGCHPGVNESALHEVHADTICERCHEPHRFDPEPASCVAHHHDARIENDLHRPEWSVPGATP
jgi:nitrate/TMAO reductase-like tetraheme cytochrome c subunit